MRCTLEFNNLENVGPRFTRESEGGGKNISNGRSKFCEKVGLVVIGVSVHDSIRVPVCLFRAFEENIGSSLAVDSNIPSRG